MNVIEGLKANYQGKVLARAIRAVKEQGMEDDVWRGIRSDFTWNKTKEGWYYWGSIYKNEPDPDRYLPKDYVDLDEESEEERPWISVEERLPDHENNVLAVLDGEVCIMAYFSFKEGGETMKAWGIVYDGLNGGAIYDDNYYPTHWMEIPKPPKTTEK